VDIFVARQPIFDAGNRLYGYELLYRGNGAATAAKGATSEQMSSHVIVNSIVNLGMNQITGSRRGFMNFSREMLVGGYWELLDPKGVVIELLEVVEPDADVVASCERLRAAGYTLALDDFVYTPRHEPLLELAEIVKFDVLGPSLEEIGRALEPISHRRLTLLAERVETAEIHEACARMGFSLFQGYFYSRPEIMAGKEMPAEQISIFRLMALVRDDDTSELALEEAFQGDLGLTYKLLRIVNSAAVGGRGVESIRHAIRLLGRTSLSRWLALLMVASLGKRSGTHEQLSERAIARAHFCERLAAAGVWRGAGGPLFMIGLFSLLA
jgi:c-di-GMP-related signal transduction protein